MLQHIAVYCVCRHLVSDADHFYSTTVLSGVVVVPSYSDYGINMFLVHSYNIRRENLPEDLHCRREEFPGDPDGGEQEEKGLQKGIMKMRKQHATVSKHYCPVFYIKIQSLDRKWPSPGGRLHQQGQEFREDPQLPGGGSQEFRHHQTSKVHKLPKCKCKCTVTIGQLFQVILLCWKPHLFVLKRYRLMVPYDIISLIQWFTFWQGIVENVENQKIKNTKMDQANPKCANNITSNLNSLKSQPKPNKIHKTHIMSV